MIKEKLINAMLMALITIIAGIVCGSIIIFIGAIVLECPIMSCIIAFLLLLLCFTCLYYTDDE